MNEFVARNGLIALDNSTVTGSLNVTNGITGSLLGTASFATSASWAPGGGGGTPAPGDKITTGSITASVDITTNTFRIISGSATYFYVSSSGNVGIGTTVPSSKLQVSGTINVANIKGSGSISTPTIFTVDGAAGRLFSVNDSLSGSLFSVNTIAGLPVIEAFSDNTVRIGQYGQRALFISQSRVGVGKETLLNANIDISGSAIITGSLNVTGSITTTGTITATTLVVQVITSSTDFITGSTRFGSSVTNTHVFTGSVNISGSSHSIIGITNITGSLDISGSSHDIIGNTTITGSFAYSGSIVIDSGSIRVKSGSVSTPKVLGNSATPVMTAGGAAGSSPTISISGSDIAGYIRVLTGTGPTANNPIVTVTFASAYSSLPYVLTTPANFSASFVAGGISGTFTTASTTGFTIFSGQVSLRGSQAYTWSYHVFGNG